MNLEDINKQYREICIILGDITVKMKGLENQKAHLFKKLEDLDKMAEQLQQAPKQEEQKKESDNEKDEAKKS